MRAALLTASLVLMTGCSAGSEASTTPTSSPDSPSATLLLVPVTPSSPPTTAPDPPEPPPPAPRVSADDVRVGTAMEAVDVLAGRIGSRPGTSPAYFRAAGWVERRLIALGWTVERQRFPTPAGSYNGMALDGGPSVNLVATRGDVRPGKPWLLVGAHLDTVPQGPGAEDNASGIGVLLAIAGATAERRTRLPLVLVAFGSEEPRGEPDDHHYGSRAYVAALTTAERRSLRGMVALDRVGVGAVVPVGSPAEPNALTDSLEAAGRQADVPTVLGLFELSSDHESFVSAGLPGARLGSTPYVGYHSDGDVVAVVERAQLRRTARLLAAWLR